MSFLAPAWLALAAAVAVPLILHLMRRRVETRRDFPAVRYLLRAEKENIRRVKLRNLLLMVLRALAVLLLALAAARPIGILIGAGHVPTGLAIVVDNSLSTSVIIEGSPLLSRLKAAARAVAEAAGAGDKLWLVTLDGAVTGGSRQDVMEAIERVESSGGRGDLAGAMTRAAGLALGAGLPSSAIVVVTDAQASQWTEDHSPGDLRVVVFAPEQDPPPNRAVALAESRPARWSPRGAVLVRASGTDSLTFRLMLGGQTVSRGLLRGSDEQLVRLEPSGRGWMAGSVEVAPDELRGDDVRHFAVWVGNPPSVQVRPAAGTFVRQAVEALEGSELVERGGAIAVSPADEASKLPALLVAPSDPVRLGAANRALEGLGVPWRLGTPRRDETVARGSSLDGTVIRLRYPLDAALGASGDTLATASGEPWVVAGDGYVLIASPLTVEATSLPVSANFIPWISAMLTQRLATEGSMLIQANPGAALGLAEGVSALEGPDGQLIQAAAGGRAPAVPGVWFLRRGDERVGALVVNAEREESVLDRLPAEAIAARVHARDAIVTRDDQELATRAFDSSAQRPLQPVLLLLAAACLIAEMVIVQRAEPRGQRRAA